MATYHLDQAAFREQLLNADWMLAEMQRRAEAGKVFAEGAAHVSDEPDDPSRGRYKASFRVEAQTHGGVHGDRAEARLISDDPAALPIEFGHTTESGTHVEGEYVLTRALDVMGG